MSDWNGVLEAEGSTVEVLKPAEGEATPAPAPAPTTHPLGGEPRWLCELGWPANPPPRRYLLMRPPNAKEKQTDSGASPRGFMPANEVCMLAGAGGVGKSYALLQLAVAVITGKPWLDRFNVPAEERGPVLALFGEEKAEEAQRRLWKVRDAMQLTRDEWDLVRERLDIRPLAGTDVRLVDGEGRLTTTTPGHDALQSLLAKGGYRLVILDPLSRFAGPETETDNHAATRFVTALEALVASGATLMVSHHTTKEARKTNSGDATAVRGASGLTDGARWTLTMFHAPIGDETQLRLCAAKANYTPEADPVALERSDDGVLTAKEIELPPKPTKVSKTRGNGNGSASYERPRTEPEERTDWYDGA